MKNTAALCAMVVTLLGVSVGAQSIAGAQVTSPKNPPAFMSEIFILCDGSVSQGEEYYWFDTQGEGNFSAVTSGTDAEGHAIIVTPGFQKGAAITYEQEYSAKNGSTYFYKTLVFDRREDPNLHVKVSASFQGDPIAGSSLATYNETLGLAVISVGADNITGSRGGGFLSLCPWASSPGPGSGGGYPARTEIIAAGSSFTVTDIQGFFSESRVTAWDASYLGYSVETLPGLGSISAGFSADVWETTTHWGSHDIGIHENPVTTTGIFAINDPPQLASRMSYSTQATADGLWTFVMKMSYQSPLKPNPLNQVP